MASRLSRSLLQRTKGRLYSAQAATAEADTQPAYVPPQGAKVSKVNELTVASVETYAPLAKISLVVRAGSRYEPPEKIGLSHFLRHAAVQSNDANTAFRITKELHQTGGSLSISSTREYMYYTCEFTRNHLDTGLKYLQDIVTKPRLRPWEFAAVRDRVTHDLAVLEQYPNVGVMELLHEAAFRDTLGHSIFCAPTRVGSVTHEQVMEYMKNRYTGSNIGLVGIGVDHKFLTDFASDLKAYGSGKPENKPAKYHGGELRQEAKGAVTYASVVTEGPSLHSKDLLSAGILQLIMGTGPYVKYSPGISGSRLSQAVAKATNAPYSISGLNANYTDSGLFGFVAAAHPENMEKVLRAAFKEFASVTKTGVTDKEVARGRNQLKSSIMMMQESIEGAMTNLAEQAMGSERPHSIEEICKMVDSVTVDDVNAVAKKLVNGKPSMAAIGNLSRTPYLDELYK